MTFPVTEHTVKTARHTTGYLACGAEQGPLLIFCHGWPELSLSWRHQLPAFAALGFRCVAPDMRGYGRSSTYTRHEDFAQEQIVQDMVELLASLGRERTVWIGHDWGSPVVWRAVLTACSVSGNGIAPETAMEFAAGTTELSRPGSRSAPGPTE